MQELHLCLFSFLAECNSTEVISTSLVSSIFSVHSSTNVSTFFFFFHSHFYLSSFQRCLLLQTLLSSLHLHLHVSCHSMCIVLLVLDIRLNTLTFKFLSTSGTHDFAYGLLILLQLPLYLLVSMLKGKKTLHY